MNIYVYDFDEPTKGLFNYESAITPRENEELYYDNNRYLVNTVEHRIIRSKTMRTDGQFTYSGHNYCDYIYLYVKKIE